MPRPPTHLWKRAVSAGRHERADDGAILLARESALLLLRRSVDMGHRRLALIRLFEALQLQAAVPPEHWAHCRTVVAHVPDRELQASYFEAEHRALLTAVA